MKPDVVRILEEHGIRPSAQRVAAAEYALRATGMISRATVYNALPTRCSSIRTRVVKS
jgi:hypothetical protein